MMRHRNALTGLKPYPLADRNHSTDHLVTQHRSGAGAARIQLEKVGSTETDHPELEQQLAITRGRDRTAFEAGSVSTRTGDNLMSSGTSYLIHSENGCETITVRGISVRVW